MGDPSGAAPWRAAATQVLVDDLGSPELAPDEVYVAVMAAAVVAMFATA